MPRRVVLLALKREKVVDRRDGNGIVARDAHFPTPRAIDGLVADRGVPCSHDPRARDGLRVDGERFGEIARAERRLNVAHVRANRGDGSGVGRIVTLEDDAPTVREILKDVRGGVLIDTHDMRAARLHRGEVGVRPLAGRDYDC